MKTKTKLPSQNKKNILSAFEFVPTEPSAQRVMDERARVLAKPLTNIEENTFLTPYMVCTLGNQDLYGIPYFATQEVLPYSTVTHIPYTSKYLAGTIHYRGNFIAIIDLKTLLFQQKSEHPHYSFIIVIKQQNLCAGVLVDQILGTQYYDNKTLASPVNHTSSDLSEILGLHEGKIAILDIKGIFQKLLQLTSSEDKKWI
jgi:chemotaxis signal transduction protein